MAELDEDEDDNGVIETHTFDEDEDTSLDSHQEHQEVDFDDDEVDDE